MAAPSAQRHAGRTGDVAQTAPPRQPKVSYHDGAVRRYLTTLAAVNAASIALGLPAWNFLPHPIAVMTIVGALTAIAAAPFITPIRQEDTRP